MKLLPILALSSSIFSICVNALQLMARENPAVIRIGIERANYSPVDRRRDPLALPLANWEVDDTELSSTYRYLNSLFYISYFDQTSSGGDYGTDVFHIAGADLANQQIGVGIDTNKSRGLLGIGFSQDEAADTKYPNVPQSLVDHGYIHTNAYSVWLNDLQASTGEILFGGINRGKFSGELQLYDMSDAGIMIGKLMVNLTGIGITSGTSGEQTNIPFPTGFGIPALMDTGTTLVYLGDALFNPIATYFNAQYDSELEAYSVSCAFAQDSTTVDFFFPSLTISVPMSEIVDTVNEGATGCRFGLHLAGKGKPLILGDVFLRSAYVVYDLKNLQIGLAQSSFGSTVDDIVEIVD
ncbi:hypothetical protein FGG08_004135 [Glutinoglossum americanum]|uniref:Peptidase A1 domain-containing protein n=1 Tax=Glutinoglossum americanum TaxID=1670608 RepID=A0A9P8L466_9PEZI|nr:hypothetical protein FGG08_004135 [Glutinoglossum americanum]